MIRFVSKAQVLAIHSEQLAMFGGGNGIRDEGLSESALARPQNLHAYTEATVPELAATLTFGIVMNHPFVDGNKRTGYLAGFVLLHLNGWDMTVPEQEVVQTILSLASGELQEEQLTDWFTRNSVARLTPP